MDTHNEFLSGKQPLVGIRDGMLFFYQAFPEEDSYKKSRAFTDPGFRGDLRRVGLETANLLKGVSKEQLDSESLEITSARSIALLKGESKRGTSPAIAGLAESTRIVTVSDDRNRGQPGPSPRPFTAKFQANTATFLHQPSRRDIACHSIWASTGRDEWKRFLNANWATLKRERPKLAIKQAGADLADGNCNSRVPSMAIIAAFLRLVPDPQSRMNAQLSEFLLHLATRRDRRHLPHGFGVYLPRS